MKLYIKILLIVSIVVNSILFWSIHSIERKEQHMALFEQAKGGQVNKTEWKKGFTAFKNKLKTNKKYYYVNTWSNFCAPCLKEMPLIDSLAACNKQIEFVFVTDVNDFAANYALKKQKFKVENCQFLANMNDFISSVCNEAKIKTKSYPMHLIISDNGEVVFFSIGAYASVQDAAKLTSALKSFNRQC